ncbi:MAG TPA: von Willebrand factor type A domain-containing protein [Tepidisphaeraceae bacterium]|jgi:hypothetical protein
MNDQIDDPRLTAYALGELPAEQRPQIEALLQQDPAARQFVTDLQATARLLGAELQREPAPGLTPAQRQTIEQRIEQPLRLPSPEQQAIAARNRRRLVLVIAASILIVAGTYATVLPRLYRTREQISRRDPTTSVNPPTLIFPNLDGHNGGEDGAGDLPGIPGGSGTGENPFVSVLDQPTSTFPLDVGNASYGQIKRHLKNGQLPPKEEVRIEEMVNAFDYHYAPPAPGTPFAANIEIGPCPWNEGHQLARIGLQARDVATSTPQTIARDVKVQVSFNQDRVKSYRLIGYESAAPAPAPATRPAGATQGATIEAGRAVTALYDVIPARSTSAPGSRPILTVKLQYVLPAATQTSTLEFANTNELADPTAPSEDFRFAAAVAGFGMLLEDSPHKAAATYDTLFALAEAAKGNDKTGQRAEFITLLRRAQALSNQAKAPST